ncbi:hypothetical protein QRO08_11775 [Paracidovorax citrulli]|uniref:Uncharacterized protein n=2 Tax=Paracidovorax citrulli TaxID=80869 RepID=A1TQS3_PARC0|nr:hypothetical protein [Paracidovorax citrulli]ABM33311.1 conserved hypothetical protein [Paracidovorax citrulli AAC00-1]ATG92767.1 hypothetical protein CQB05_00785 [Paracidovorax citrulli]MVT36582.1 hypothetical protein [Paracidovorax citrulli]PVY62895.1 hypothetical protein C8E08_0158 [Paracidovorax citrulli]REG68121.1 hypothetical protein C8E07_1221 [Paracidovorax citrulli]
MDQHANTHGASITDRGSARLLAVVEVEKEQRIRCQQPGCNHTVYKAIHVVDEQGTLLVLGSTCFAKQYGSPTKLGDPAYGNGGGRVLTSEERQMLQDNTRAFIERFAKEYLAHRAAAQAKLQSMRARPVPAYANFASWPHPLIRQKPSPEPAMAPARPGPWPWMKPRTSMAYFKLKDGSAWVRVERHDGQQMLAPLPVFEGWDEALPALCGTADLEHTAYVVPDIRRAIAYLRERAVVTLVTGVWKDIAGKSAETSW